jgi:TRAP-type C4-dicarboxylate transport system permease small subunit
LALEETSSTGLAFPMWIYYSALPAGGALMSVRYIIRFFRYVLCFDPATMALGHIPDHELATNLPPVGKS